MSPEQYHDHIDALMLKYHKLEEDMRGTHGNLMDRLDENLLHHHGHPHYHSGYDSKWFIMFHSQIRAKKRYVYKKQIANLLRVFHKLENVR